MCEVIDTFAEIKDISSYLSGAQWEKGKWLESDHTSVRADDLCIVVGDANPLL